MIALVDLAAAQSAGKNYGYGRCIHKWRQSQSLEIEPARDVKANDKIGSVSNKA